MLHEITKTITYNSTQITFLEVLVSYNSTQITFLEVLVSDI